MSEPILPHAVGVANAPDPVTLEIVRNALISTTKEMRAILVRTSRSPILKEAGDLSCALTDSSGKVIAQGTMDQPVHLGAMAFTVKEFLARTDVKSIHAGDMYLVNAPDVGGNHLPDVKAITPIFCDSGLFGFSVNCCHWPDVGGAVPGSYAVRAGDIFQEGLVIPPTKVFSRGKAIPSTLDLICANVRNGQSRYFDILAQRAANEVARSRVVELIERYDFYTIEACLDWMMLESERRMRERILAVFPEGVYTGEDFVDDDGVGPDRIRIRVKVERKGDSLRFDFDGTDPQCKGPMNTTLAATSSAVFFAVKALLDGDQPVNDGCYRPIEIVVPRGCVLNPYTTAAIVAGNHETTRRVVDAVFGILVSVMPDSVVACNWGSAGVVILGFERKNQDDCSGDYHKTMYEVHGGGQGASSHQDGESGVQTTMGNTMNTSTEVLESEYPIQVESYGLAEGSGGLGRHRGGCGIVRRLKVLAEEASLTTMFERVRLQTYGLLGGQPGRSGEIILNPDLPNRRMLPSKINMVLKRGDVLEVRTAGGGGYGPVDERAPELIREDELNEYYRSE